MALGDAVIPHMLNVATRLADCLVISNSTAAAPKAQGLEHWPSTNTATLNTIYGFPECLLFKLFMVFPSGSWFFPLI